jgi:hypothetical protein
MKRLVKVMAIVAILMTLTVGNSMLMAAPTQGAAAAVQHSSRLGLFDMFLQIFGAVWGGNGHNGAIWGIGNGHASTDGAIWGCGNRC